MQLISRSLSRVIHSFGVESSGAGAISPVLFVADTSDQSHALPGVLEELRARAIRKCLKVSISCIPQLPRL
jgi:hypothetical protein